MSNDEPTIIKEFRELYEYVRLLGRHVNQIHTRLEKIETIINEVNLSHSNSINDNKSVILDVRENMVNKSEFYAFVEQLKASIGEILPSLPTLAEEQSAPIAQNSDPEYVE